MSSWIFGNSEALDGFVRTQMDSLVLGTYAVEKES
jgi:hypothetical protein